MKNNNKQITKKKKKTENKNNTRNNKFFQNHNRNIRGGQKMYGEGLKGKCYNFQSWPFKNSFQAKCHKSVYIYNFF